MSEIQKWILMVIVTFVFLIFGVNHQVDPPVPTYFGVGMIFVLIVIGILLAVFQNRNDT